MSFAPGAASQSSGDHCENRDGGAPGNSRPPADPPGAYDRIGKCDLTNQASLHLERNWYGRCREASAPGSRHRWVADESSCATNLESDFPRLGWDFGSSERIASASNVDTGDG